MEHEFKHWVSDCAEKHGLFAHFAAAAHTSRECSKCRDVRKSNRPTQEAFQCRACGHSYNADVNAALVIRERFLEPLFSTVGRFLTHYWRAFRRLLAERRVSKRDTIRSSLVI